MTYEEVLELGVSGYSIKEIAKMVGVSEVSLRVWLRVNEQITREEISQRVAKIRKEMTRDRLNSELLPCPFCEGKAEIRNETIRDTPSDCYEVVFVTCLECGASTERKISDGYHGLRYRDDEIAAIWNRRVKED